MESARHCAPTHLVCVYGRAAGGLAGGHAAGGGGVAAAAVHPQQQRVVHHVDVLQEGAVGCQLAGHAAGGGGTEGQGERGGMVEVGKRAWCRGGGAPVATSALALWPSPPPCAHRSRVRTSVRKAQSKSRSLRMAAAQEHKVARHPGGVRRMHARARKRRRRAPHAEATKALAVGGPVLLPPTRSTNPHQRPTHPPSLHPPPRGRAHRWRQALGPWCDRRWTP